MMAISLSFDCEEARPDVRVSPMIPAQTALPSAEVLSLFREGVELLGTGEPRAAIQRLERVVACAPRCSDGYVGLGMAYALDSQVYPALDSFEHAAKIDPENFYAHFKFAQFCFKLRIPAQGYAGAEQALRCAATPEERRLVAQILKEERQREANGVRRPAWTRPFSGKALYAGLALLVAACAIQVARLL